MNRDFSGGSLTKTVLPLQGSWVQFLVRELRSHLPRSVANNNNKKINKINKNKRVGVNHEKTDRAQVCSEYFIGSYANLTVALSEAPAVGPLYT